MSEETSEKKNASIDLTLSNSVQEGMYKKLEESFAQQIDTIPPELPEITVLHLEDLSMDESHEPEKFSLVQEEEHVTRHHEIRARGLISTAPKSYEEERDELRPLGLISVCEEEETLVKREVPVFRSFAPKILPEFKNVIRDRRSLWLPKEYGDKISFEMISHDRPYAIYRFQLQDMLAFSESEPDIFYGRPSYHDIWTDLESESGLLVVAYNSERMGAIDSKFDINSVFDEQHRIKNAEIFNDLLGGILLKPSYLFDKPVLRIYSLVANPLNNKNGIRGIGTKLLRFVIDRLSDEENHLSKRYKGVAFYFDGFDRRVNSVYFTKNSEFNGLIVGMADTLTIPKLKGFIPLDQRLAAKSSRLLDFNEIKEISIENALNGYEGPFRVEIPEHVGSERYTQAHKEIVALWQKRLDRNGSVAFPSYQNGKLYHNIVPGRLF